MFAWDAFFYVGMPTLIVRMGKILLFAWGAYFHSGMPIFTVKMRCENGHPDPYIHVNIGLGMPIFTSSGVPIFGDAYIHLTPATTTQSHLS